MCNSHGVLLDCISTGGCLGESSNTNTTICIVIIELVYLAGDAVRADNSATRTSMGRYN